MMLNVSFISVGPGPLDEEGNNVLYSKYTVIDFKGNTPLNLIIPLALARALIWLDFIIIFHSLQILENIFFQTKAITSNPCNAKGTLLVLIITQTSQIPLISKIKRIFLTQQYISNFSKPKLPNPKSFIKSIAKTHSKYETYTRSYSHQQNRSLKNPIRVRKKKYYLQKHGYTYQKIASRAQYNVTTKFWQRINTYY
uniref:Uncharacterized protein n=1 Tax=Lactuca sativa TaxID=4236 RepID=A0A9R1VYS8_LACSA|nr:hypothetical protein LSAT_V11C400207840 [Lactuca sativa]